MATNYSSASPNKGVDLISEHGNEQSISESSSSMEENGQCDSSLDGSEEQIDDHLEELSSPQNEDYEEGEAVEKKDESLELRDELDFEEGEKESGEEGEESEPEHKTPREEILNKEDGELSEEEEDEASLRQEPKTVCRFFNKGQCTWGTNCRFLHPGVSDKGNYNMFAPSKIANQSEKEETSTEKEKVGEQPREFSRRHIPEPSPFESAWERGLRYAKEMMKRASKRKETDADFEEKRFNLSLGQAELDRENDYYTRPASPVYKPVDVDYLDPYEKQAIRHFRGGHFENIEVRYNVEATYPNRGGHVRSRREKFEREVTERIPRKIRPPPSPPVPEHRVTKEKRYPRPRGWHDEKPAPPGETEEPAKQEAEKWADPWARRRTPVRSGKKKVKVSRSRRSYSTGSSSRSSRSSRSSSYSSYSQSSSRSSRSRSSSRSITPPIHPRQRAMANRGGRGGDRGARAGPGGLKPRYPPNMPPATVHTRPPVPRRNNSEIKDIKPQFQRKINPRPMQADAHERVDMFGRTIRKEIPTSPTKVRSISPSPVRARPRKFSVGPSRSRSPSKSSVSSRSKSSSSGSSSWSQSPNPRRKAMDRMKMTKGTVSYGNTVNSKPMDIVKAAVQKQQIKLSLKRQLPPRVNKPIMHVDEDSGESDVDARILKKRKTDLSGLDEGLSLKHSRRQLSPSSTMMAMLAKKPVGRREELLKQLRAVEDAIARKRGKPLS